VFVETAADGAQSGAADLNCSMCVNKVLHMQRVFLTERESDGTNLSHTTSAAGPAGEMEDNTASVAASSSLTMDTASSDLLVTPAAESSEGTLPLQTVPDHQMDLSN